MAFWTTYIDTLVMALVTLSQAYGGSLGWAIITLSLVARLALLPVTIWLRRRGQARQAQLKTLEPEIAQLRRRYRSDPNRLSKELTRLYSRHGYSPFDATAILGGLVQLPILAGLYSAIGRGLAGGERFLWIGNLARPDALLTVVIASLAFLASYSSPDLPSGARTLYAVLPAAVTLFFAWQLTSGIGLYWATSSVVSVVESLILQRKNGEQRS
jgi:YidC/Oxa1 family membrane protein insertase